MFDQLLIRVQRHKLLSGRRWNILRRGDAGTTNGRGALGWPAPACEVREPAARTDELDATLPKTWLLGNRPSRLADSLKALRAGATQCRRWARL